jgi:DNA-binding PadR family transcriptional regulator
MAESSEKLSLEYILLGLLEGQPQHGYALYKQLQDTRELSRIWHVKRSKVYYLLDKLADQNLLSSRVMAVDHVPDRKVYSLTEEGRQAFRAWYRTPVRSGRIMRVGFLSRLFFALREGQDPAVRLIEEQIQETLSWLKSLSAQLEGLEDPDLVTEQVFTFRIGQIQAMLDWLKECRQKIQAQPQQED